MKPKSNATFAGSFGKSGVGLFVKEEGTVAFTNSIFWENNRDHISGPAVVTFSTIQGGHDGKGNIDVDPLLLDLADNGGCTQSHALEDGNPAIDAGSPDICPPTDQRVYPRLFDGNGDGIPRCDIGAYEFGLAFFRL